MSFLDPKRIALLYMKVYEMHSDMSECDRNTELKANVGRIRRNPSKHICNIWSC